MYSRSENRSVPLLLLALLALTLQALPAAARTWQVAKDGSGDFTVIQDAVDASASGDIIKIGPGIYSDLAPVDWMYSAVVVLPEGLDLTLIGAGSDQTILSGAEQTTEVSVLGVWTDVAQTSGVISIHGIGFTDMYGAAIHLGGESLEISHCEVASSCSTGFRIQSTGSTLVENCRITSSFVGLAAGSNSTIRNCSIVGCLSGVEIWPLAQNVLIEDCKIATTTHGVYVCENAACHLVGCYLTTYSIGEIRVKSIFVNPQSMVELTNCEIDHRSQLGIGQLFAAAIAIEGEDTAIVGTGNQIRSNAACVAFSHCSDFDFTGNDFLRSDADAYFVRVVEPTDACTVDLEGNYWGTDDIDEIASWIHDGNDEADLHLTVDFDPIADESTPVENRTWSDLKATYRGR